MAPGVKVREGYELWHPNQEKTESKTTKAIIAFVLVASAVLLVVITIGGWDRLQSPGVGIMTIAWAALYVIFALLVLRWRRGLLPVTAAMAIVMVIFAAVAADGWFARAKDGLTSPALPEELLGLLTVIVIPVQVLLIAVAMVGFNQAWSVEEERPIGGRRGAGPGDDLGPGTHPARGVEHDDDAVERSDYETGSTGTVSRQAMVEREDRDWVDDGPGTSPAV
ncbi:MAG: hypothetical protein M3Q53_00550 [Actinomycetota bacterium]|nr:hypothetical protein [Actinomycetota bacterium]